ncbi:MAG: bifunctional hydroxymethylpyrimidine kinase/phosphomethylpyrimidine kinase, partial [Deltaproteobacteria bacterium]|nr:bifunctional hydroxymethylpyrimidine kinase/phosphomethylpyrimidine kinase [Deltaproteobacteria bacterium]
WDPVGMPSRGEAAFDHELFDEALRELAPHLALITPNAHELAAFAGRSLRDLESALVAAHDLAQRADTAVLVKGGHLPGDEALDVLAERERVTELRGPRLPGGEHVHGTGCALASAIAAHLARGAALADACRAAKQLVADLIASPVSPGRGAPAIV